MISLAVSVLSRCALFNDRYWWLAVRQVLGQLGKQRTGGH